MNRCPQCMQQWNGSGCVACGYKAGTPSKVFSALPSGTLLNNRYLLGNAMKDGFQSIIYIAWDNQANLAVLLEEFYPKSNVTRGSDGTIVSKRNADTFQKARDLFLRAPYSGRPLTATDAFLFHGTAIRVYAVNKAVSTEQQVDLLLDHPVYFRNAKGYPLMTVNALPMPSMPAKRSFSPSASLARKRRRLKTRKILLAAMVLSLVLLVAIVTFYQQGLKSVALDVPLYEDQALYLAKGEKEQDISKELLSPKEGEYGLKIYQYSARLRPGEHRFIIRNKSTGDGTETLVKVDEHGPEPKSLKPQTPLPLLAAEGRGGVLEQVVERLKELGYLDLDKQFAQFDEAVQAAYRHFGEKNNIQLPDDTVSVTREGFAALQSEAAISVPYVVAEQDDERALKAVERLKELHYLDGTFSAFTVDAQQGYKAFADAHGLGEKETEISVAGAKLLMGDKARPKPVDIAIGSTGDKASALVLKLIELQYLPEGYELSTFDKTAWEAYRKLAGNQGTIVSSEEGIYLSEWRNVMKQDPNPLPEEVFVYGLGEGLEKSDAGIIQFRVPSFSEDSGEMDDALENVEHMGRAGEETGKMKNIKYHFAAMAPLDMDAKQPLRAQMQLLTINIASPELLESLVLTKKTNGREGASISLQVQGKTSLLISSGDYALSALAKSSNDTRPPEKYYFPHFGDEQTGVLGTIAVSATPVEVKLSVDWEAVKDYYDYNNLLPLPQKALFYALGEKKYLIDQQQITDQPDSVEADGHSLNLAGLHALINAKKLPRREGAAGKASTVISLFDAVSDKGNILLKLFAKEKQFFSGFRFVVEDADTSKKTIPLSAADLLMLRLPPGAYRVSAWEGEQESRMMEPVSFQVSKEAGLQFGQAFNALEICGKLRIMPYIQGDKKGLLKAEGFVLPDGVEDALLKGIEEDAWHMPFKGCVPAALIRFYQENGQAVLIDDYENALPIESGELYVTPNTYKIKTGEHTSGLFTVPHDGKALFDKDTLNKMWDVFYQQMKPTWMIKSPKKEAPSIIYGNEDMESYELPADKAKEVFNRVKNEYIEYVLKPDLTSEGDQLPQVISLQFGLNDFTYRANFNTTEKETVIYLPKPKDKNEPQVLSFTPIDEEGQKGIDTLYPLFSEKFSGKQTVQLFIVPLSVITGGGHSEGLYELFVKGYEDPVVCYNTGKDVSGIQGYLVLPKDEYTVNFQKENIGTLNVSGKDKIKFTSTLEPTPSPTTAPAKTPESPSPNPFQVTQETPTPAPDTASAH